MQPVSRRPWCSGTIKRVCPQVDPQAWSCRANVRMSDAGSQFARPTYVFQLKHADVLRAREIRFRAKLPKLLPTDLNMYGFRAQERREDSDRRSDVELYGPLGSGSR